MREHLYFLNFKNLRLFPYQVFASSGTPVGIHLSYSFLDNLTSYWPKFELGSDKHIIGPHGGQKIPMLNP